MRGKRKNFSLFFYNLGCAKNVADSEVLLAKLAEKSIEFTGSPERADVIFINTCGFLRSAEEELREVLEELRDKFHNKNKTPRLILGGCFPQRLQITGKKGLKGVDLLLGVDEIFSLPDILEDFRNTGKLKRKFMVSPSPSYIYQDITSRAVSGNGSSYVKIADGCNNECSFCIIPLIKGKQRSRTIDSITRECELLAGRGIKEINLISQDTNAYGMDLGRKKYNLQRLLEGLEKIDGLRWIRLLYLYPRHISSELLKTIAESKKILPYFDIPIQHADPSLLKAMKRGTSPVLLRKLFDKIREKCPEAILRTSVIVGFPGEDEKKFSNLLKFLEETMFHYVGVFEYSREKGASAYNLGDPISSAEKRRRSEIVAEVSEEISNKLLSKFIGEKVDFLCEQRKGNFSVGRVWFQAPEVDGNVYVDKKLKTGEIKGVKLDDFEQYNFKGVIDEEN